MVNEANVMSQIIDGEAIIINMETGCYYSLTKVGVEIWHNISKASTLSKIVSAVETLFDCSGINVPQEVENFLSDLQAEELIEILEDNGEIIVQPVEQQVNQESSQLLAFEKPRLEKHSDMRDFLLVDPIHHVNEKGWPHKDKDNSPADG